MEILGSRVRSGGSPGLMKTSATLKFHNCYRVYYFVRCLVFTRGVTFPF